MHLYYHGNGFWHNSIFSEFHFYTWTVSQCANHKIGSSNVRNQTWVSQLKTISKKNNRSTWMLQGITCHTGENHLNLNLFLFQFILIIDNIINRNNNCIDRQLGVNSSLFNKHFYDTGHTHHNYKMSTG